MPFFTKKPVTIEARQVTPRDAHDIYLWIEQNTLGSFEPMAIIEGDEKPPESGVSIDPRDGRFIIATLEGLHWVDLEDWVIRGVKGEFYPCKPDIFELSYDPASVLVVSTGPDSPPETFTLPVVTCPACSHGIDAHGPGDTCGVGDVTGKLCACRWSPNDIAGSRLTHKATR